MSREEMRLLARVNVADWPPLAPEQRDRLYILLAPMRADLAAVAVGERAA